jgi:hypothetical protein
MDLNLSFKYSRAFKIIHHTITARQSHIEVTSKAHLIWLFITINLGSIGSDATAYKGVQVSISHWYRAQHRTNPQTCLQCSTSWDHCLYQVFNSLGLVKRFTLEKLIYGIIKLI